MAVDGKRPPEERVLASCAEDKNYQRYFAACKERHTRYLKIFDLFKAPETQLSPEDAHQQIITDGFNPHGRRVIA